MPGNLYAELYKIIKWIWIVWLCYDKLEYGISWSSIETCRQQTTKSYLPSNKIVSKYQLNIVWFFIFFLHQVVVLFLYCTEEVFFVEHSDYPFCFRVGWWIDPPFWFSSWRILTSWILLLDLTRVRGTQTLIGSEELFPFMLQNHGYIAR